MNRKVLKWANYVDKKIGQRVSRLRGNFDKIFCIGLHKTATSSFYDMFAKMGFRPHHGTDWCRKPIPNSELRKNTAFSNGGGHFWFEDYEFGSNHEVRMLDQEYPNSKFILNTRPLKSWALSKMIHAGWSQGTKIKEPKRFENPREAGGDGWKYKSPHIILGWILNRIKYHKKVINFFGK